MVHIKKNLNKKESKGAKQITDIVKNAEAPKNQDKGRYPG